MKKNKEIVIPIIFMILCFIATYIYVLIRNNSEPIEEKEEKKEIVETKLNYNFDELNDLKEELNKEEINAYLLRCLESDGLFDKTSVKVSDKSLDIIINKLKKAEEYKESEEEFTGCYPNNISYYIGKDEDTIIFNLNYSSDENTLIIKYNDKSYRFIYNSKSDLINFIENLK